MFDIVKRFLVILISAICALPTGLRAQNDIREESIYFLITSRFYDGDPSNNRPTEWCSWYKGASNNIKDTQDVTWRGDFKGLVRKLDYIKDLGFTAVWITP
ncbi:MAG: glycosidase, partial [Sphingomonadales bacterium]|nr:glycosidase [Sphingomonadales bacterium]